MTSGEQTSAFLILCQIYPKVFTLKEALKTLVGNAASFTRPADPICCQFTSDWTLVACEEFGQLGRDASGTFCPYPEFRSRSKGGKCPSTMLEMVLRASRKNLTTSVQTDRSLLEFCSFMAKLGFDDLCLKAGMNYIQYLFQNCAVFVPLENHCYMQITGTPIYNAFPVQSIPLQTHPRRWPLSGDGTLQLKPMDSALNGSNYGGDSQPETKILLTSKKINFKSTTTSRAVNDTEGSSMSDTAGFNEKIALTQTLAQFPDIGSENRDQLKLNSRYSHSSKESKTFEMETESFPDTCVTGTTRHNSDTRNRIEPNDSDSDSVEVLNIEENDSDYDSDFSSNRKYNEMRKKTAKSSSPSSSTISSIHKTSASSLKRKESKTRSRLRRKRLSIFNWRKKIKKRQKWKESRKLGKQIKNIDCGVGRNIPRLGRSEKYSTNNFPLLKSEKGRSTSSAVVRRGFIFHSSRLEETGAFLSPGTARNGTPNYSLHTLHPSMNGARKLATIIFCVHSRMYSPGGKVTRRKDVVGKLSRTMKQALPLFQKLLWNYRHKLHTKKLLDHHCPIPEGTLPQWEEEEVELSEHQLKIECAKLVRANLSHDQVFRFLRSLLVHLVPLRLWGSSYNRQTFFEHLKRFIELRRWESMSIEMMTLNIKLSHCDWLKCPSPKEGCRPHPPQPHLFHKFILWLMEEIVVRYTKSFFYVTEHQDHRNHVFYFRKKVWSSVQDIALRLQMGRIFSPIPQDKVQYMIHQNKTLGVSKLRFLPKADKVRPIVNLGSAVHIPSFGLNQNGRRKGVESVNRQLLDVFHVLNYEKTRNPTLCGSMVFGYHHVHEKLKKFALEQQKIDPEQSRPLYFAHFDISNCYNSMLPEKLMDILRRRVLTQESYLIRRYCSIFVTNGKIRRSFIRSATTSENCCPFFKFAVDSSKKYRNCIFVDQVMYPSIRRGRICELLKNHLFGNIVQLNGRYYQQTQGIPQGSKLSTMLCGFYYADMERCCLPRVDPRTGLLMRFVDDFLLVTRESDLAREFSLKLTDGIPSYNCTINQDKGGANFSLNDSGEVLLDNDVIWLEWCGLLVNVKNMDVRVDYSRYSMTNIRDNITIVLHSSPLTSFLFFMLRAVQLRCLPVLLDCTLLSEKSVVINMYQGFLLAGVKYLAYITALPQWRRREGYRPLKLERKLVLYFFKISVQCFGHFWKVARTKCLPQGGAGNTAFTMAQPLCMWLGCHAFKRVLSYHEPKRLSLLIRLFSCKLDTISNFLGPELLKRCFRAIRPIDSSAIFTVKC